MVLFFESTAATPAATLYMGRDKYENEELLRYGLENDVWFHVDKLSSAHLYLRLPPSLTWETIPDPLLSDCSQLVKANSIEGNKKNNLTIIYTPWSNVKKTRDMSIGSVTFHNDRKVKRFFVKEKDSGSVNRLNKTKREVSVDHEEERQKRLREEGKVKKSRAIEENKAALAMQKQRQEEAEARDYSKLFTAEAMEEARREKESKPAPPDDEDDDRLESDDSFM